ncbi:hypothetical protein L597_007300000020 [Micrococcus luteus J28]|nr:hypothetical protein L597_007300000020 [Micrococcus luteus J28]
MLVAMVHPNVTEAPRVVLRHGTLAIAVSSTASIGSQIR